MILGPPVKSGVITEVFQTIKDPRKNSFQEKRAANKETQR